MVRWMRNLSERLSDCAVQAYARVPAEVVPLRAGCFHWCWPRGARHLELLL